MFLMLGCSPSTTGGYLGPLVSGAGVLVYGLILQVISVCGDIGDGGRRENAVSAAESVSEAGMAFSVTQMSSCTMEMVLMSPLWFINALLTLSEVGCVGLR